ncbi:MULTISPECIES: hypothetical protein [Streptomyces]|uniref:Integral membrane protein n=1 Tax=Streptomyces edwardsiae TaxID=3075527 RepID=A0ABU2QCF6_9ACTN|nr:MULTISPECIES: hypothetical protein [unclassified Streptomyces]MDT0402141.1 hypothetical protein [Streptomyces sp. DSM 41635]
MGTKTVDETAAGTGAETGTEHDETAVDATGTEPDTTTDASQDGPGASGTEEETPSGVGQGAAAVVSVALGLVSLTGSWVGTVAAARETLVGQLETAADAGVATQVKEVYGDAWQTSALWGGLFALTALIVGVVVLARPAFGTPGRTVQAPWIKSVAWAGVSLGVVGLLLAVLKYTDVLLGLPATG